MKVIKNIKFKELRDKGANALDIKDDEVVQMSSKNGMLCIVTQEYLLQLLDIKNNQLIISQPEISNHIMGFIGNDAGLNLQGSAKLFSNNNVGQSLNNRKLKNNLQELLKNKTSKNLEDRVNDIEETLKKLLHNKEEDNGTK